MAEFDENKSLRPKKNPTIQPIHPCGIARKKSYERNPPNNETNKNHPLLGTSLSGLEKSTSHLPSYILATIHGSFTNNISKARNFPLITDTSRVIIFPPSAWCISRVQLLLLTFLPSWRWRILQHTSFATRWFEQLRDTPIFFVQGSLFMPPTQTMHC